VNRIIVAISFALAAVVSIAHAEPTKEQLEQAKAAFTEGKSLHDQGKLPEAVEKFKESYRLSQNPLLLYNIGFTLDEAGQKDNALLYYRKFLSDAPANAAQRKTVDDRVKVLEKEKLDADLNGKPTDTKPTDTKPVDTKPEHTEPTKFKPAGTYSEKDFQHQIVDSAPPGKPLDITAFVPEDSGWTVVLAYRGAGDSKFIQKTMKWRYKELVARIPAAKLAGSSIQYYLDVKDQAGNKIAGSGKMASPNLVEIDASASPRFYPDWNDEGDTTVATTTTRQSEDEDPLHPGQHKQEPDIEIQPKTEPSAPGTAWNDVGSTKFEKAKWISTASAGALLAGSLTFYILAGKQADNLVADSKMCGTPPCRAYDQEFDQAWQNSGQSYQTLANVTFVVGFGAAVVSGYLWYRQLTAKQHGELKMSNKTATPETTWVVIPTGGPTGVGAAAAVEF
jgi:tetratricopeptide (TPR) repeat protein